MPFRFNTPVQEVKQFPTVGVKSYEVTGLLGDEPLTATADVIWMDGAGVGQKSEMMTFSEEEVMAAVVDMGAVGEMNVYAATKALLYTLVQGRLGVAGTVE